MKDILLRRAREEKRKQKGSGMKLDIRKKDEMDKVIRMKKKRRLLFKSIIGRTWRYTTGRDVSLLITT